MLIVVSAGSCRRRRSRSSRGISHNRRRVGLLCLRDNLAAVFGLSSLLMQRDGGVRGARLALWLALWLVNILIANTSQTLPATLAYSKKKREGREKAAVCFVHGWQR